MDFQVIALMSLVELSALISGGSNSQAEKHGI
jgi:hypothetical protein